MAEKVLKDCCLYIDGLDLSGDMNTITITKNADVLDVTTFGSSFRSRRGGLQSGDISGEGFWNASTEDNRLDDLAYTEIGTTSVVLASPHNHGQTELETPMTTDGPTAYFGNGISGEYNITGQIGEMLGYSFGGNYQGALVRGIIGDAGVLSSSNAKTPHKLGYRSTQQTLYACVEVSDLTTGVGDSVTVSIQHDDSSGFATPTTTIKFSLIDSKNTGLLASTESSTAENWYRVVVTGSDTSEFMTGDIAMGFLTKL